jgi:hypothetical protein
MLPEREEAAACLQHAMLSVLFVLRGLYPGNDKLQKIEQIETGILVLPVAYSQSAADSIASLLYEYQSTF